MTIKLIKPATTEMTYRTLSLAPDRHSLAVTLLVPFYLHHDAQAATSSTSPVWDAIKPALEDYSTFDEGWPKLQGEYLVCGAAYPPTDSKQQPVSAQVSVGDLNKRLAVFGDRFFNALGGISDPLPFERMPISPSTALGGEGFDGNPYGKGAVPLQAEDGSNKHPLPNIELPDALMTSLTSRPGVAGFWPYYPDMPQRAQFLGKFDENWTQTRWPHLPIDTNFTYFQVAPPDQRLAEGFWQGGERFSIQNMHPTHRLLTGTLPALRARLFPVVAVSDNEIELAEVQMRLETIYLLPDQLVGIALYRTVIQVGDPDAKDIVGLCTVLEALSDAPRAAVDCVNELKPLAREALGPLVRKPPAPQPDAKDENARLDELTQKIRQEREVFLKQMKSSGMTDAQVLGYLKQNPQTRQYALAIEQLGGGFDKFFENLEGMIAMVQDSDSEVPTEAEPDPASRNAGRMARLEVLSRKSRGESCRDLNLPEADLSGLDLSGIDFSGAMLAGANFVGATLRFTKFDRAVLGKAIFTGADLSGASFSLASAHKAQFQAAVLNSVNAVRADLAGSFFIDAVLEGADFSMANLSGAHLQNTHLVGVTANGCDFTGAILTKANLSGAKLLEAIFAGADLTEADLSKAACIKASFSVAKLHKAKLVGTDLTQSSADEGTQATGTDFRDAQLDHASWVGANLSGANLDRISGEQLDLSDCNMSQTSMRRAVAKGVRFDRAVIDQSNLSMSNFMEGSFAGATLTSVALQSCNLYGVNLLNAEFKNANLEGCYIDRTILAKKLGKTQL